MPESIAMSTHPSAPNPVATAMSGPNSSPAQRSMASGGAFSNSSETRFNSSAVVSCVNDKTLTDMSIPSAPSAGQGQCGLQLFFIETLGGLLKPFKTLAQLHNLTDNYHCGRSHAGIQSIGSDRSQCSGDGQLPFVSTPPNHGCRRFN